MKNMGYGQGYEWQAGYKHPDGFLPTEIADLQILPETGQS
jgi:hypothetical protein